MMRFDTLQGVFQLNRDRCHALSGFVMFFWASWDTTIGKNNHFNRKQTRDLDWVTDPLPVLSLP